MCISVGVGEVCLIFKNSVMKLKSIIVTTLLISTNFVNGQTLIQNIRGTIIDEDAKFPLIGANVFIIGSQPPKGTTDIAWHERSRTLSPITEAA